MVDMKPIAVQCSLLSRAGGGLPSAILPVAERLARPCVLVTHEVPEELQLAEVVRFPVGVESLRIGRYLQVRNVELVHTHGLWSWLSLAAVDWRRRTKGPVIVSPHGMLDSWALSQGSVKKKVALSLFERRHLNGAACVHALNQAEYDAIRAAGITAPIAIIPNGVDVAPTLDLVPPSWMNRPTLLFLGRLHAKKGIAELIGAWTEAHKVLSGWQLALAGWDDGPNDFREQAARSGAPIVFPGALYGEEKDAAFAHCAAFVLPSHSEGLPMTVLEAWANGKPVMMTDACNLSEGFTAGAAARITTDPQAMARVLVAKLRDQSFLERAGVAGLQLVDSQFSWDAITSRFEALYDHVLGIAPVSTDLVLCDGRDVNGG